MGEKQRQDRQDDDTDGFHLRGERRGSSASSLRIGLPHNFMFIFPSSAAQPPLLVFAVFEGACSMSCVASLCVGALTRGCRFFLVNPCVRATQSRHFTQAMILPHNKLVCRFGGRSVVIDDRAWAVE